MQVSRAAVQQLTPVKLRLSSVGEPSPSVSGTGYLQTGGSPKGPLLWQTFPFMTLKPDGFPIPEVSSNNGFQREALLPRVQVHTPTEPAVNTCWPVSLGFHRDRI